MNAVHIDENWRQRLRAEHAAAGQWRDSWGFLEQAKPPGAVHVDRQIPSHQMSRTIAEQGALYPYLQQTFRENRDGHSNGGTRFNVGGLTHSTNPASAGTTTKVWRGDPDAPRWNPNGPPFGNTNHAVQTGSAIVNGHSFTSPSASANSSPSRFSPSHTHQQQRSPNSHSSTSAYASAAASSSPVPSADLPSSSSAASSPSSQSRPKTPLLHLDSSLAKTLMPKYEQDIGGCVWTSGVDPSVKYRHPVTTSHTVGWGVTNKSLEFFTRGAGPHGLKQSHQKLGL